MQFPSGGSITIIAVTTLSGGDITHAIPDNTGYITEGQLFLRRDTDIGKVIVDPFRSLSRLKQLVIGKKTREDHPQVMNAAVRLFADAANAKTKQENGFDLTDYDERTLKFALDYSNDLLAIDVNIEVLEAEAGTRCAGLTAAGVALADAGIPMTDIPVACAAGKIGSNDENGKKTGGHVVLDLGKREDNFGDADLPIAISPRTGEIILLQMDGHLTLEEFDQALTLAIKGCNIISEIQKDALLEKYQKGLEVD